MVRKIFRTGNSLVVSLPRDTLESVGLSEGAEVSLEVDRARGQIILTPARKPPPDVDETFARQVAEFIEEYRPALEALARA